MPQHGGDLRSEGCRGRETTPQHAYTPRCVAAPPSQGGPKTFVLPVFEGGFRGVLVLVWAPHPPPDFALRAASRLPPSKGDLYQLGICENEYPPVFAPSPRCRLLKTGASTRATTPRNFAGPGTATISTTPTHIPRPTSPCGLRRGCPLQRGTNISSVSARMNTPPVFAPLRVQTPTASTTCLQVQRYANAIVLCYGYSCITQNHEIC